MLLRRGARGHVVQRLDRRRGEGVQLQLAREVRRRVDQRVGDRLAADLDAGGRVRGQVRLHRGRGRRLGEAGAEVRVTHDQRLEVGQATERLDPVAGALDTAQRVGRGDLAGRGGVPHRAGANGDRVGLAAVADHGRRGGQVRRDRGGLAGHGRVVVQVPLVQPLGQLADRVIADVVVNVVDVTLAEHVQGAARLWCTRAGVNALSAGAQGSRATTRLARTAGRRAAATTGGDRRCQGYQADAGSKGFRAFPHRLSPLHFFVLPREVVHGCNDRGPIQPPGVTTGQPRTAVGIS